MRSLKFALIGAVVALTTSAFAFPLAGNTSAKDPSRIVEAPGLYLYWNGGDKLPMHYSSDMRNWTLGQYALPNGAPSWVQTAVPGGVLGSPDVLWINGIQKYVMFYHCTQPGTNTSVIGALTTADLASPAPVWQDAGGVIRSDFANNYNAVDPAPFYASNGELWMTFGGGSKGVQIVKLNETTLQPISTPVTIAGPGTGTGSSDLSNPFVWEHNGLFYLFVTHNSGLKGLSSTDSVSMGRSSSITGPYRDSSGGDLTTGPGVGFLKNRERILGPGSVSVANIDGTDRISIQYADALQNGGEHIGIQSLQYQANGWPSYGSEIRPSAYRIFNKESGLQMGISSSAQGSPIVQVIPTLSGDNVWNLSVIVNSLVYMRSGVVSSNGALKDAIIGDGIPVVNEPITLADRIPVDGQHWIFDQLSDGTYRILSPIGMVMEVPAGNATVGSPVQTNFWLGTDNQRWVLR